MMLEPFSPPAIAVISNSANHLFAGEFDEKLA